MWRSYLELVVLGRKKGDKRKEIHVEGTPLRIGSDPNECKIVIKKPKEQTEELLDIAPIHTVIDIDADNNLWRVFVRSEEGEITLLNGLPIYRPQPLNLNDIISIGPCDIQIIDAGIIPHLSGGGENVSFLKGDEKFQEKLKQEIEWYIKNVLKQPNSQQIQSEEDESSSEQETKQETTPLQQKSDDANE